MKKKLQILSISLALTSATGILHAEGNINAGKQKTAACTSCHGDNGNSLVTTFPKLAQQHASYLDRQLHEFKDGSRNDPMMSAVAQSLTDEDIADISAYYARQKISKNTLPVLDADDDDEDDHRPAARSKQAANP